MAKINPVIARVLVRKIITTLGEYEPLDKWQSSNHLPKDRVSEHILFSEVVDNHNTEKGSMILSELVMMVFEDLRKMMNEPVYIVRGYSSIHTQAQVRESYKGTPREGLAATWSTHTEGMAIDIHPAPSITIPKKRRQKVLDYAKALEQLSKEKYPYLRMGYKKYIDTGMNSLHFDIAPFYFAEGRPFHDKPHSTVWEIDGVRW